MIMRVNGSTIILEGEVAVEDADTLAQALQDTSLEIVDWTGAKRLHTAIVQLVMAAKREIRGPCGDPFVARWIEPAVVAASREDI